MSIAVTLAVAALAESAGRDACAECCKKHDQLTKLLDEVMAIRLTLEVTRK